MRTLIRLTIGILALARIAAGEEGTITTIAGGLAGDGGPVAAASMVEPHDVQCDRNGNLFFTDRSYHVIRRVDAQTGIVTRVAGNGVKGFAGDGGPATEAELNDPFGMAVDHDGNVYFCEFGNQRIRFVNRQSHPVVVCTVFVAPGAIETICGTGLHTGSRDGTSDDLGDGGPALLATLAFPRDLRLEPGSSGSPSVVFDDIDNARVRRIDGHTGIITTIAGNGLCYDPSPDGELSPFCGPDSGDGRLATQAPVDFPTSFAWDAAGNLFIGEAVGRIRRVDAVTGLISTIGGVWPSPAFGGDGGPVALAQFSDNIKALTFDPAGNLLLVDEANNVVRRIVPIAGEIRPDSTITTVAGTGFQAMDIGGGRYSLAEDGLPPTEVDLANPTGIALFGGRLFTAEMMNGVLRVITPDAHGQISGDPSERMSYVAGRAGLKRPQGVAVDAAGNVYAAEALHARIRRVDPSGALTTFVGTEVPSFSIGGTSPSPGDGGPVSGATVSMPSGLRFDAAGNLWFIDFYADLGKTSLRRITATIDPTTGRPALGPTSRIDKIADLPFVPFAMTVGKTSIYVNDAFNNQVWRVRKSDGKATVFAGTGASTPTPPNSCSGGTAADKGDGGKAIAATFAFPIGVALDASESRLFIGDTGNRCVRVVDLSSEKIETLVDLSSGNCTSPNDLVVDGDRFLYIAVASDFGAGATVQRVDLAAEIPTALIVAGKNYDFTGGWNGDGPATEVDIDNIGALAVGPGGKIFIAEFGAQRICRLDPPPP
jgi:sugar lactone lactonase YvrE